MDPPADLHEQNCCCTLRTNITGAAHAEVVHTWIHIYTENATPQDLPIPQHPGLCNVETQHNGTERSSASSSALHPPRPETYKKQSTEKTVLPVYCIKVSH